MFFVDCVKPMVRIVLIRPGSTDYDAQGRIRGNLDVPLNERGREQATSVIEGLKPLSLTALYSCACRAAQETSEIIGSALKIKPKILDRLQNLDHGLWQGMLVEDVKRKQPKVYKQWQEHPENVCPPNGEMLSEVAQRVATNVEKLVRKHRLGAIGLVAPEPLASVIRCRILGSEVGDLWKATNGCGRFEVFEIEPQLGRAPASGFETSPPAELPPSESPAEPLAAAASPSPAAKPKS